MTAENHHITEGPWAIETDRIGQHTIWNHQHYCVALIVDKGDESDANAHAIAAVPEMIAALEMANGWGHWHNCRYMHRRADTGEIMGCTCPHTAIKAALSKAQGETP